MITFSTGTDPRSGVEPCRIQCAIHRTNAAQPRHTLSPVLPFSYIFFLHALVSFCPPRRTESCLCLNIPCRVSPLALPHPALISTSFFRVSSLFLPHDALFFTSFCRVTPLFLPDSGWIPTSFFRVSPLFVPHAALIFTSSCCDSPLVLPLSALFLTSSVLFLL